MGVSGPPRVVSPHLLVAQAVAAALRSVGTPAEASAWEATLGDDVRDLPHGPPSECLVLITDGLDNSAVIEHVGRLLARGDLRVLVVASAEAAIRWGALLEFETCDVITLHTSVGQLADAVERMREGSSAMDPEQRLALRTAAARALDQRLRVKALMATLSPQQLRVLELLASGRRVSEVGAELGVAHGTVRSHVKALRAKLGAPTQLKAVAMYHQASDEGTPADLVPSPRRVSDEPATTTAHEASASRR